VIVSSLKKVERGIRRISTSRVKATSKEKAIPFLPAILLGSLKR
jgi:prepilin signal peptidase PulO-like enzyme (type II secretory pathway)